MSYQPLARKYRPRKFSDLIGQEAVTQALCNAIKIGREPAGVIFSGVRGIGKTTTARLYAKALNCEQRNAGEPCDLCDSCSAIASGYHEDVLEIDGASHNGVDEVRALKETVSYVPHRSKYKVYIIDEVHMLSISAFNALLKTLEEPPHHVVFIFATTELQKVPQTIIGRCQTFYLQKLSIALTVKRIREILTLEQVDFEEDALSAVAREGHGSMRDALTFLDQAIALGEGKLNKAGLAKIISSISGDAIIDLLEHLARKDGKECVEAIATMDQAGWDFTEAVEELARYARHGFLCSSLEQNALSAEFLGIGEDEYQRLSKISSSLKQFELNRIFRTFIKCRQDLDGSDLDRFVFENYCLEWCLDPGFPSLDQLLSGQKTNPAASPQKQVTAPKEKPVNKPQFVNALKQFSDDRGQKKNPASQASTPSLDDLGLVKASQIHSQQHSHPFPETWEALVTLWKLKKPLEARKFEEVYLKSFSKEKIELGVNPESLAAKDLLNPDAQRSIRTALKALCGFYGAFQVVPIDKSSEPNMNESILESKNRERSQLEKTWIQEAKDHSWTQGIIAGMQGHLEKIVLKEHR
ncbi:MAG: DNA polymerase III subunit gamma/tau [Oligoflexales bacterium]